jgi:hypothetical protein
MLKLVRIHQDFPKPRLLDLKAAVLQELQEVVPLLASKSSVAVAVGSRGIAEIALIVKTVVDFLRAEGCAPFIVPAMGSHGGATAEGQTEILASYGITEAAMGVPVRATMETVVLTEPGATVPAFMDRHAYEADGVVLINRVKPHTDYHGDYESGLVKMSVIGLGKHRQALAVHSHGVRGLRELMPQVAAQIFRSGHVLFGLAVVENAYDAPMLVRALPAEEIMAEEPELLELAKANMPRLPRDDIDVLIIDRMGKDISGVGIDPNIIGRMYIRGVAEPARPRIKAIAVADLTAASHGNAVGVGLADVITQRLFDKIDRGVTYENIVTSTFFERGKIPLIAKSAAQAYAWALRSCGVIPEGRARVVRIRDTLHLGDVYVSSAILDDVAPAPEVSVEGDPVAMFDAEGALTSVW